METMDDYKEELERVFFAASNRSIGFRERSLM